jgi:glycosyltransferase involved in cell wall biosynthesis
MSADVRDTLERAPLITVGLPVYNGLPYLGQALESLCRQDLQDVEIIVCDNASSDGTGDLVRDLAVRDRRIKYVRNPRNLGSSNNHNKVFSLARGRYFRWAASDDFVSTGALSRCVRALEDDSTRILAFPETVLVDAQGIALRPYDDGDGWSAATAAERLEVSLTQWGYCNVIYGVVRADVLRQTRLLGSYPGSDLVLQADLAIRGAFTRVRGEYYHRRIHDGCTDERAPEQLAQFFVPERSKPFDSKLLRIFYELTGVVWDARTSIGQKRRMYRALVRHAFGARDRLAAEASAVLTGFWARRSPGQPARRTFS